MGLSACTEPQCLYKDALYLCTILLSSTMVMCYRPIFLSLLDVLYFIVTVNRHFKIEYY